MQYLPSRWGIVIFSDANPHLPPPQPVLVVVELYIDRCNNTAIAAILESLCWLESDRCINHMLYFGLTHDLHEAHNSTVVLTTAMK